MISTSDIKHPYKYEVIPENTLTISYSFDISNSTWDDPAKFTGKEEITNELLFSSALSSWARYLKDIQFQENDVNPNIVFFKTTFVESGTAGSTDTTVNIAESSIVGSEIAIKSSLDVPTAQAFQNILHEIGHALGLKGDGALGNDYNTDVTVMSYNIPEGRYAITPMALDILALEEMYGATTHNHGSNNVYSYVENTGSVEVFSGTKRSQTIMDTGGINDEFNFSGYSGGGVDIDLRKAIDGSGNWTGYKTIVGEEYIYIAHNTEIENAIGTDDFDSFIGNDLNNRLEGRGGNDTINAGLGNNTVYGGDDDDTINIVAGASGYYDGGADNDTFVVGGAYNDISNLTLIGGAGTQDKVTFTGTGYVSDQRVTGTQTLTNSTNTQHITLDGFEEVILDEGTVLADVSSSGELLSAGPAYDYSFVTSAQGGADFDIGIYTKYEVNGSSTPIYEMQRAVSYAVDVNGVAHSGGIPNQVFSHSDNSTVHSYIANTVTGRFVGTNNGDTVNVHREDINGSGIPGAGGYLYFTLGYGDDTVTIDDILGDKFFFTYKGGTDTITNTGFYAGTSVNIIMDDRFLLSDASISSTSSNNKLNTVTITTSLGSLTLSDLIVDSQDIAFASGGSLTVNADGSVDTNGSTLSTYSVEGDWGDDTITNTDSRSRTYYLLDGDDSVSAGSGDDTLYGGDGFDQLYGGAGNDTFYGGGGLDYLSGGLGDDNYHVSFLDTNNEIFDTQGTNHLFIHGVSAFDLTYTSGANYDIVDPSRNTRLLRTTDIAHIADITFDNGMTFTPDFLAGTINPTSFGTSSEDFEDYYSSSTAVFIDLLGGDDFASGSAFNDIIFGGDGLDEIYGDAGHDYLHSGGGDSNYLSGDAGNDILFGGDGWGNHLFGGEGDDEIHGEINGYGSYFVLGGDAGNDKLFGYSSSDGAAYYNTLNGVVVSLLDGVATEDGFGTQDQLIGIDNIYGSWFDDFLTGDNNNNLLRGDLGEDLLIGHDGNDQLYGDNDDDILIGGAGNDYLVGGIGIDTFVFDDGFGNDTIHDFVTGEQINLSSILSVLQFSDLTITASGADSLITVGSQGTILVKNITDTYWTASDFVFSAIAGTSGDDTIYGTSGADRIFGFEGSDYIVGQDGDDEIYGGDGDDYLYGNGGADTIYGENGDDRISGHAESDTLYGGDGVDRIYGYEDSDLIYGGSGSDKIYGDDQDGLDTYTLGGADEIHGEDGNDQIFAGVGDDVVYGDAGADDLYGHAGNDMLYGGSSNDRLYGGDGNDTFYGGDDSDTIWAGSGDDIIIGGNGRDYLNGEAGADTFYLDLDEVDRVRDFDQSEGDKINIADLLTGFDSGTDDVNDFVDITIRSTTRTDIRVNEDGQGNDLQYVGVIYGDLTGETVDSLVANGTLIVE